MAAGTQKPGGTTVPWVTWSEDNGSGIHQIFVSRLVGDHFELMNDGQPISTVVNDSTRPDITFSRHTPYVSWIENVNGTLKTFVGHFEGNAFKLDTTAGAADADIRSPISSNCIATPFNADGEACQAGAAGTPYFLYLNGSTGVKRLLAKAYAPSDVVTGAASNVTASSATIAGRWTPVGPRPRPTSSSAPPRRTARRRPTRSSARPPRRSRSPRRSPACRRARRSTTGWSR